MAGARACGWPALHGQGAVIFVTVGTQLGFDRLIATVDAWAAQRPVPMFVQFGPGAYVPRHCDAVRTCSATEWERRFAEADRVVSHVGVGTLLKALDHGKPLIAMPRLAALNEHRNDHQLATAARFRDLPGITIVESDQELVKALDGQGEARAQRANSDEWQRLIRNISAFIESA